MCLITTQQEPLIAQEDMIVYKMMNKNLQSIYMEFNYNLNELYQTDIREEDDRFYCFDIIHRKYILENFPDWNSDFLPKGLKCFSHGFHSVNSQERIEHFYGSVFECTIPKGSEYYTEPTGTIVSNQIIINKLIKE